MLRSEIIASYLMELLERQAGSIEIKRNDLATYFQCAPSQINYVLSTRFTHRHGYIVESQRGGGGCIRIVRAIDNSEDNFFDFINNTIKEGIDAQSAKQLIIQMKSQDLLTVEQAEMILVAISSQTLSLPLSDVQKNQLRANIMRAMLLYLIKGK